jgi:hypothetical protein
MRAAVLVACVAFAPAALAGEPSDRAPMRWSDSASAALRANGEMNAWGPIVLEAATRYESDLRWQPRVGMRVRLLRQERRGVDLAVGVRYDGIGYEGAPTIETFLSLSRQWGRLGLYANVAYGQEPEPSQRNGAVSVAFVGRVADKLYLGVDAQAAFDLDTGREALGDEVADLDFVVSGGATLRWSVRWLSLVADGGPALIRWKGRAADRGGFVTAGIAAVY